MGQKTTPETNAGIYRLVATSFNKHTVEWGDFVTTFAVLYWRQHFIFNRKGELISA